MRRVRGQEVHWYLILNQFFFEIYNILVLGIWRIRGQEATRSILEDISRYLEDSLQIVFYAKTTIQLEIIYFIFSYFRGGCLSIL